MNYYATGELYQLFLIWSSRLSELRIAEILLLLILLIPKWILLKKAGDKGWKCLIPFYGKYTFYKTFWSAKPYWGLLATYLKSEIFVMLTFSFGMFYLSAILLQNVVLFMYSSIIIIGLFFSIIACLVACAVISIKFLYKMSRYFGHGAPFTAGLVFLPVIFYFIIAFERNRGALDKPYS